MLSFSLPLGEFNVCAMTAKDDRTWCSLTYDYDKDQQWRYCKGIILVTV